MYKSLLSILFYFLVFSSQKSSPTNDQIAQSLIRKLFKVCGQENQISLLDCQGKMIQNDKKNGNYRDGYNYTGESIYMMEVYDINRNGKLDKKQLYLMAMDIMNQKISDQKIKRKLEQMQRQGKVSGKKNTQQNNQEVQQKVEKEVHQEVQQQL